MKKWMLACTLFLFAIFLFIPTAHAFRIETLNNVEVQNDFVLGPGKTELFMDPGETKSEELIVTNRLGRDTVFKIELEDFTGSEDPSRTTILLGDKRNPHSLQDFVEIERTEFTLKHGERARIPVWVTVPADAEPGGRYLAVLLAAQPSKEKIDGESGSATGGAKVITRLGTLFFVRVAGDIEESGQLASFKTKGGNMFSSGPINFEILFKNDGSIHLAPYGRIEIFNMQKRKVGEVIIDPWFAMPGSTRLREVTWETEFLLGRYTAKLEVNRGYEDVIDELETTFWVIPWRLVGGGIVGLAILIWLFKWIIGSFEIKRKSL